MSDFDNSRDFGANENTGASSITQETSLEGKDGTSLPQGGAGPPGEPQLDLTVHLGWDYKASEGDPPSLLHTELSTTAEGTTQSEEPKKPKRVSKTEAGEGGPFVVTRQCSGEIAVGCHGQRPQRGAGIRRGGTV